MTGDKLSRLLEWFKENEIKWEQDLLEIRQVEGSFGVYALKDISKQKRLVSIPKTAILSAKSTGIANILDDEQIDGGCSLAIAVLYEMSQGADSPWYGYLQALPSSEDLPVFWSDSEKAWFKGTEIEDAVYNDLNDLKDDYDAIVVPLFQKYPYIFENAEKHFSFDLFCRISTLISSRSFEVDAYHKNALVPFADIFNHRSGNEHVHFETDFDVCDACGQLEYCEHQYLDYLENGTDDEDDEGEEQEEEEWSDVEEMDEDENDGHADSDAEEEKEEENELPDLEELENAKVDFWQDDDDEEETKDTCDMVLDKPVKAGQEIFNTYGQHPNIVLLSKYGFCHDNNENDYISVGEDAVFETCAKVIKDKYKNMTDEQVLDRVQERFAYFLTYEHILCPKEEDDDEQQGPEEHEHDGCCGQGRQEEGGRHHHENGCCGDNDDDHDHEREEAEEQGRSKPYFANVEGLYEDSLICLLHTVFVDEKTFEKFANDVEEALKYFERLASDSPNFKKTRKYSEMQDTKKLVYTACKLLSERRRRDYLDEKGEWIPVEKDEETRRKVQNKREYYALTCRISEKRIVERSIDYYASQIMLCNVEKKTEPKFKKKPRK